MDGLYERLQLESVPLALERAGNNDFSLINYDPGLTELELTNLCNRILSINMERPLSARLTENTLCNAISVLNQTLFLTEHSDQRSKLISDFAVNLFNLTTLL